MEEKRLYYQLLVSGENEGTMRLSGCFKWIEEHSKLLTSDIDSDDFALKPVWLTDTEFEALEEV